MANAPLPLVWTRIRNDYVIGQQDLSCEDIYFSEINAPQPSRITMVTSIFERQSTPRHGSRVLKLIGYNCETELNLHTHVNRKETIARLTCSNMCCFLLQNVPV